MLNKPNCSFYLLGYFYSYIEIDSNAKCESNLIEWNPCWQKKKFIFVLCILLISRFESVEFYARHWTATCQSVPAVVAAEITPNMVFPTQQRVAPPPPRSHDLADTTNVPCASVPFKFNKRLRLNLCSFQQRIWKLRFNLSSFQQRTENCVIFMYMQLTYIDSFFLFVWLMQLIAIQLTCNVWFLIFNQTSIDIFDYT